MGGQGRKTIIPLFSPKRYRKRCREPRPLPLGEVSPKVTERASPARKSRGRSDGQALCQSDTIAASGIRRQRPCPLRRSAPAPPKGEPLACRSGFPSYNLSVSLRSTAPLVGEPLAKPFTLRGLPRPPLGRGGGSASALTERLSPAAAHGRALLRTTSQSRFARQGRVAAPSIRRAPLASCWPLPQQLLPVSATGGGRRRCP